MKDITLVFPQWQGSIDNEALTAGALALAEGIKGLPALNAVQTAPFRKIKSSSSIAGKDDIVKQLQNACTILEQENPDRVLLLGGDCSTETGPVSWMSRKYGADTALIWLDAHPDLNTPESSQSGRFQGMAHSALLGNTDRVITDSMFDSLHTDQVFCVGVRVFDPPELEFIASKKMPFFGPGELERDPAWLAKQIHTAGFSKVYIHMDVDAINPIGFPHGKPAPPAGLNFSNILKIIEEVGKKTDICGLGITEFHPGNERGIEKASQLIEKTLPGFLLK